MAQLYKHLGRRQQKTPMHLGLTALAVHFEIVLGAFIKSAYLWEGAEIVNDV